MSEFFLELFSEEIPARMQADAAAHIKGEKNVVRHGDFQIAHEPIADRNPLRPVLARTFRFVHVDMVDQFPQQRCGQRFHLHELADRRGEQFRAAFLQFQIIQANTIYTGFVNVLFLSCPLCEKPVLQDGNSGPGSPVCEQNQRH